VQLPDFAAALQGAGLPRLRRASASTLQLNLTRRCNLACHHCHVEASPVRTEAMDDATVARVLALLEASPGVECVDLTGGAPELHPRFRALVHRARALGRGVIDRCNLTVFVEPGCADLPEFLAEQGVRVVASLPCYSRENVDRQRGRGVFEASIEALRRLNALGYGKAGSHLQLDLVFNPQGMALPGPQAALEADYRRELGQSFGIEFHRLLALANMPIARFARELERSGQTEAYMALLVNHFNPATLPHVMCRSLVSVDHAGRLFDCDFNQALDLPAGGARRSVWDVASLDELLEQPIATAAHCFGCTAGAGSSCGGALVGPPD
jgi:radical SAM/Cys-rich protein